MGRKSENKHMRSPRLKKRTPKRSADLPGGCARRSISIRNVAQCFPRSEITRFRYACFEASFQTRHSARPLSVERGKVSQYRKLRFYLYFAGDIFRAGILMRNELLNCNSVYNGFYNWRFSCILKLSNSESPDTWDSFIGHCKSQMTSPATGRIENMRVRREDFLDRAMIYPKTGSIGSVRNHVRQISRRFPTSRKFQISR